MTITISHKTDVAILTLNRPEVLNAIDMATADALMRALDQIESDQSIALVITGAGRAFCAGSDLGEQNVDVLGKLSEMHAIVHRLVEYPKLTIAALNGMALGGGLELALGCALRIAAPGAKLGLPEIKIAAMPCYGGTQLLPRLIGTSRALSMMLTGEPVNGAEALSFGLVTAVDDDPLRAAIDLAQTCAAGRENAQRAIRSAVHAGALLDLKAGLELERRLAVDLSTGDEVRLALETFNSRADRSNAKGRDQ
ncbi:MAG: enoyl-CoA hydratase/isomerase family protein [Novosphingobium sp.]